MFTDIKEPFSQRQRFSCVVCGGLLPPSKLTIQNMPVYLGTVPSLSEFEDKFINMDWTECTECGVLQISCLPSIDYVYPGFHSEAIGQTWERHAAKFLNFILNATPKSKSLSMLEFGGSDGKLSRNLISTTSNIKKVFVVEPNLPNLINNSGISYLNGFIEDHLDIIDQFEIIMSSHVIEHLINPLDTMRQIIAGMKPDSFLIFSVPNQLAFLEAYSASALNFEHTYYYSPKQWETIFESLGMILETKEYFEKHSIFYSFRKKSNLTLDFLFLPEFYPAVQESNLVYEMFTQLIRISKELSQEVENLVSQNKKIYIFGANIFSQLILTNMTPTMRLMICGLLDNSNIKEGQRLYGFNLIVDNPAIISEIDEPWVVVMPGPYQFEIEQQLIKINQSVKIINFNSGQVNEN
jgi:SAM-dependent methyltransferase